MLPFDVLLLFCNLGWGVVVVLGVSCEIDLVPNYGPFSSFKAGTTD
jgi:hypothetical protein